MAVVWKMKGMESLLSLLDFRLIGEASASGGRVGMLIERQDAAKYGGGSACARSLADT